MKDNSKVVLGVLVILIGVSMLFSNMSLFGNNLEESDSISLSGIDEIVVSGSSENINIIKSNSNDLKAELKGNTSGFSFSKPKLEVRKSGKTLTIEVKRSFFSFFSSSKLDLDIYISDNYKNDLSLNLSSGSLEMDERFDVKKLDIDVSSGNMTIDEIHSEEANIDISSGSLRINAFTGDIDGDISSGNVDIEYLEFDNDITFHASSGSVDITLPKNSDFDFKGYKSSGSVKTEFDLNNYTKENNKIEGTFGKGGNKIDLDVSSGNISINKK